MLFLGLKKRYLNSKKDTPSMKWELICVISIIFLAISITYANSEYSKIEVDIEIKEFHEGDYVDNIDNTYYTYPQEQGEDHGLNLRVILTNNNKDSISFDNLAFEVKIESSKGKKTYAIAKEYENGYITEPGEDSILIEITDSISYQGKSLAEELINEEYKIYVLTSASPRSNIESQSDTIYLKIVSKEEYNQKFSLIETGKRAARTSWEIIVIIGVVGGVIMFFVWLWRGGK